MNKILFFDVDGTLYNSNKELPLSAKQALQQARANGYELAIATGRAPFMIRELLQQLAIDTYVCFNGQYVVYKGKVIFTDGVAKDYLKEIVAFGQTRGEPVVFLDDKEMVATQIGHNGILNSLATLKYPYPRVDAAFFEKQQVYQSLIYADAEAEKLYRAAFPEVQLVRWHPLSCDVLPKHGSKARGVEKLMQHIGLTMQHTIAFGDGLNDIEMITAAGVGVVMANGHEKTLAVADVIAPHVDEDGLAKVMRQLEII